MFTGDSIKINSLVEFPVQILEQNLNARISFVFCEPQNIKTSSIESILN